MRTLVLGRAICSRLVLPGVMEADLRGVPLCVDGTDLTLLHDWIYHLMLVCHAIQ